MTLVRADRHPRNKRSDRVEFLSRHFLFLFPPRRQVCQFDPLDGLQDKFKSLHHQLPHFTFRWQSREPPTLISLRVWVSNRASLGTSQTMNKVIR